MVPLRGEKKFKPRPQNRTLLPLRGFFSNFPTGTPSFLHGSPPGFSSFMFVLHYAVAGLFHSCSLSPCLPIPYNLFSVCSENSVVLEDIIGNVLYSCDIGFIQRFFEKRLMLSDQYSIVFATTFLVFQPSFQCCSAVKAGL